MGLLFYFLSIIQYWMLSGLFIGMYEERTENKKMDITSLFRGFDHGMPIFMYLLIMIGITFAVILIPMIILILGASSGSEAVMGISMLIFYLFIFAFSIILGVLFMFTIQFITFGGMEAWDAMKTSAAIMKNNLGTGFVYFILIFLLNLVGVMLCFVGLLVTVPMSMMVMYFAFQDVFQIESKDATDEIIEHLV